MYLRIKRILNLWPKTEPNSNISSISLISLSQGNHLGRSSTMFRESRSLSLLFSIAMAFGIAIGPNAVGAQSDPGVIQDATLEADNLEVIEGEGGSSEYTLKLRSQPTNDVTVTITVSDPADVNPHGVTVAPMELTFTRDNWNDTQTVTVSAAEDDNADDPAAAVLSYGVSGGNYDEVEFVGSDGTTALTTDGETPPTYQLTVDVMDNDSRGLLVDPPTLSVPENGSATYTVRLTSQPIGDNVVVVDVTGDGDGVTADTDRATAEDQTSLTFTKDDWYDPQTVTVRAAEDDNAANEVVTLTNAAGGSPATGQTHDLGYTSGNEADVVVTAEDKDLGMVEVSPTSLTLVEGGAKTPKFRGGVGF